MDSPRPTETRPVPAASRNGNATPESQSSGEVAPSKASPQSGPAPHAAREPLLLSVLKVVMFLWVGIVLAILPWQDRWTQNTLLFSHPLLRNFLDSYFTRGAVSGLGMVNLWIAATEFGRLRRP